MQMFSVESYVDVLSRIVCRCSQLSSMRMFLVESYADVLSSRMWMFLVESCAEGLSMGGGMGIMQMFSARKIGTQFWEIEMNLSKMIFSNCRVLHRGGGGRIDFSYMILWRFPAFTFYLEEVS